MANKRMVIAGTGSGVGKTTLTIGLMAAFKQKGYCVQGFKCGPDYIDPTYHTAVTGRQSRNLDSWMLNDDIVQMILARGSEGADISFIEGVMGFYDGKDPTSLVGSTAEISLLTQSPVLLVVNCASMARSAAAIVKGFQLLHEEVNIVAVIANKVGSEGHYKLVKSAIEEACQVPVVGYLTREDEIELPERHLGLIPSVERGELDVFFEELGGRVSKTIAIEQIYELAEASPLAEKRDYESLFSPRPWKDRFRIAVAKDYAFNFYYPENIELLEAYGADIVYFSPINNEPLPAHIHGLYIGGGFPEEFASQLARANETKASIRAALEKGLPTLAECGGFMYLTQSIETTSGNGYSMVGFLPGRVKMQQRRAALGYREIKGVYGNYLLNEGDVARGHEFHYSTYEAPHSETALQVPPAYETKGRRGVTKEGFQKQNVVAGYTHLHFASCPRLVENWFDKMKKQSLKGDG